MFLVKPIGKDVCCGMEPVKIDYNIRMGVFLKWREFKLTLMIRMLREYSYDTEIQNKIQNTTNSSSRGK